MSKRIILKSLAIALLLAFVMFSIELIWRIRWEHALLSPPIFEKAEPALAYSLQPNASVAIRQFNRATTISTTPTGTRTVVGVPERAPFRIHLVGDSQIFGWGLSDEETVASRLQAALGKVAVVINHGVPGYGPTQYRHLLRTIPAEDIVVIFHTEENDMADAYNIARPNEVACGFLATMVRSENKLTCAVMRLASAQLVLAYIHDFLHPYAMTPLGFSDYSEVAGSVLHFRVAKLYATDQKLRGERLIFSVVPWKGRYSREWRLNYAPPSRHDVAFIASPFFDQLNLVETMRAGTNVYIDGDTHLSPAGAALISQSLTGVLQDLVQQLEMGGQNDKYRLE